MSGQQIRAVDSEAFGPAMLAGAFFGFHLFVMVLSVWLLGTTPQVGVMADLTLNFLVLGAVAFACLGRPTYGTHLLRTGASRWAILFLLFSGSSLLWTAAVSIPAAIVFWCAMAADLAIVILLLRSKPSGVVAASLFRGFVYGACAVAVLAWLLPTPSDNRLGYEGLLGPNAIGFLCAFGFFLAQYLVLIRHERHKLAMLLLGATMLRSLSKTTIVAFLLSQTLLLIASRDIPRRTKIFVSAGALLLVAVFSGFLLAYLSDYATSGSQAETLSGRIGIWAIMLAEAVQRPWFGHGFHSVWNVIPPYGPEQFEVRHAHNEILQQFYAYGVAGIVLFCGIYTSFLLQIRRLPRGALRTFLLSLLLFILVRGLADTEVFDLSLPLWMIVLFSALMEQSALARIATGQTQQSPRVSPAGLMQPQT